MAERLYCCSSYYQLLISLLEVCADGDKIDLVLELHGLETAEKLAVDLKRYMGEYVDRVFVCPDNEKTDTYRDRNSSFIPWQKRVVVRHVELVFAGMDLKKEYSEIRVFWDLGYVGTYLNIKKIHYTLLEDSLDSYKRIRENRPNYRYIFEQPVRFKLKRRFGIGVIPFGYSPLCDRVEVNDKSGIQIPLEKVVEKNRQGLFEKLSQKDKQSIFSLFFAGENDLLLTKGNSVLILTEPFALTNRLPGKNAQIALYRDIIREYGNEKKVYIKPHPRDDMDYRDIFKAAVVLPKNVPMEVLNFSDSFKVDTSVTVTSSAIYGITCDRDKIYLGADFLKKYRL